MMMIMIMIMMMITLVKKKMLMTDARRQGQPHQVEDDTKLSC